MADKYTPERATSGKEWLRTWWKKVENNFTKIFGAVNKHIDGTADRHTADMIDYSDTEEALTVKAKLDTKVDKKGAVALIDEYLANSLPADINHTYILYLSYVLAVLNGKTSPKSTFVIPVGNGDSEFGIGIKKGHLILKEGSVCVDNGDVAAYANGTVHKLSNKIDMVDGKGLSTNDYTAAEKAEVAKIKDKVDKVDGKSLIDANIADSLTYDSTNGIINSDANLLLTNANSVAAYNGTFRGDITIGQLGANKWAYRISPITGFSTSVDVTCTSGNKVHSLANKADSNDVLTKTNTAAFTPTADYQPATKKYVDDAIKAAIEKYNTEAMALLGED